MNFVKRENPEKTTKKLDSGITGTTSRFELGSEVLVTLNGLAIERIFSVNDGLMLPVSAQEYPFSDIHLICFFNTHELQTGRWEV